MSHPPQPTGRVRLRLACGHWSPVLAERDGQKLAALGSTTCLKCGSEVRISYTRQLKPGHARPARPAPPPNWTS